ncbi:hypothetical protein KGQ20_43665 [Catenulispora sp. NF23]|uniref:Serine/threonine protein kinase n=1 Tax=Catenulispora pinistramenti TaxID=2705254 RepID=A0ABS5L858_9ACTN|nr:hypothetical protein [Catenulispora pinistramenti]MBS2539663.1 hypothetical protein [Catenulispora pinistramenti]MBS2554309.1 hypothetical protein [Catenulispora pinistramenti]
MSEGFPGKPEAGDDEFGRDGERLHAVMTQATAHIGPVRVDPARLRRAQRRHRLSEGGVVAGVLSVALVAAAVTMHGGGGGAGKSPAATHTTSTPVSQAPTAPTTSNRVTPVGVSVYDSDNGTEGKGTVNQLLSGTGAWTTDQYCGKYATHDSMAKDTGVVFDLGGATSIGSVTVNVGTPGASLEMWTADDSTVGGPPAIRPGQPPAGFTKVASATDVGSTAVLTPAKPVKTQLVLIWFTGALPPVPNPDDVIHCGHDDGQRFGDSITSVQFTRG